MTNNINNKFILDIHKIGTTPENRHIYEINNSNNNPPTKISVSNKDNDTFEKNISVFNKIAQNDLDTNSLKKKKSKVIGTILLSGIAGMAIPGYFTRNSKTLTKVLSIVGGGIIGALIGAYSAFKYIMIPNIYKDAQNLKQTLKTLDIRKEK